MNNEKSQEEMLLELMQKTPVVTVQYIMHKLSVNSPRKLISALKRKGYPIKDKWIAHIDAYGNMTRYKEYWLEENERANVL